MTTVTSRLRRIAYPLAGIALGLVLGIAPATLTRGDLACCTIPTPPPCATHPEMCA
ncbi:hypothetical protein ACN27G_28495 [Plantactinospora sp. WMMB334]|uniref:hypothetical protein n=1 Tax=Plantactinospora sp. WMMB334 TaxID=3404119 RepID=UPI003B939817